MIYVVLVFIPVFQVTNILPGWDGIVPEDYCLLCYSAVYYCMTEPVSKAGVYAEHGAIART